MEAGKAAEGSQKDGRKPGNASRKQGNAREIALDILLQITEEKKMYHTVLSRTLAKYPEMEKKDRAFLTTLCTGCIERLLTLDYLIGQYSMTPVPKLKPVIRGILRMGFYQLWYMDVPPSAVCNEAVKLAKKRRFTTLSGFVNGILRNAARYPVNLEEQTEKMKIVPKISIRYSMPEWLTECFIRWYGEEGAVRMFQGFLEKPDVAVRVNLGKIGAAECKERLLGEGIAVRDGEYVGHAFHLSGLDSVERLRTFQEGLVQVQDESSMLPVLCAGIRAGDKIIDCCAAPGGKALQAADTLQVLEARQATDTQQALKTGQAADTQQMLEAAQAGMAWSGMAGVVSARDISDHKLKQIRENVERTGYQNIEILLADALELREADIGTADIVLADLPCSGLGIIGRKPDIKYNETPESLEQLEKLQRGILSVVAQYLKPGGVLLYSTCTMNKAENIGNAEWIQKELGLMPESLNPYLPEKLHSETTARGWLQLEPVPGKSDGFFVSRFRSKSEEVR